MPNQTANLNSPFPWVNTGLFRTPVTLLEQTSGTDSNGNTTTTFAAGSPPTVALARVDYLRGTEVIKSGLDVSQNYIKVTMWYQAAFTAQKHIQLPSGSEFIIQSVENVQEMNSIMVLMCLGVGANS